MWQARGLQWGLQWGTRLHWGTQGAAVGAAVGAHRGLQWGTQGAAVGQQRGTQGAAVGQGRGLQWGRSGALTVQSCSRSSRRVAVVLRSQLNFFCMLSSIRRRNSSASATSAKNCRGGVEGGQGEGLKWGGGWGEAGGPVAPPPRTWK